METGIEVVEEAVLRVLLSGIGVGKHSFGTGFAYLLAEPGKVDLLRITEVQRHIRGTGIAFVNRLVGRIKVKEGLVTEILLGLMIISVQNNDILQQLVVKADQFLFQQFYPSSGTESDGQLSATVYGVNAVIAGTHEEDKQGGTDDVIRVSFIVVGTFLHEVGPSSGMFLQCDVFVLYSGKYLYKLLRRFLDDAVDIDQCLVGVVDDASDFRIGLSYSEEEGTAADKRFYIGIHLPEVFRKGFDQYGKQSSFASHPGEAGFSRQVGRRTFLFFFHVYNI